MKHLDKGGWKVTVIFQMQVFGSIFLVYLLSASAKKPRTNHYGPKENMNKIDFFPKF